uniref:Uncharacterized protein n=1 Tax=Romanomermis culicivorax TaxID=13658 RepID=A0A915IQQ1_ROMCU
MEAGRGRHFGARMTYLVLQSDLMNADLMQVALMNIVCLSIAQYTAVDTDPTYRRLKIIDLKIWTKTTKMTACANDGESELIIGSIIANIRKATTISTAFMLKSIVDLHY